MSSATSTSFPLHDLPKVCFFAVAEQLDNTGRRRLSQTCQRFRRLLIPPDRFIDHPKSYWDEESLDNEINLRSSQLSTTTATETRRPLHSIRIEQCRTDKLKIRLIKEFRGIMAGLFHTLEIYNRKRKNENEKAHGLYEDNGKLQTIIFGEFPAIIHEIIQEINRYCVFRMYIRITITSSEFIRLPLMIHRKHEFNDIPMFVDGGVIVDDMPKEAVRRMALDYKEMKISLTLRLLTAYDREQAKAKMLTTLKALKQMWTECSAEVIWQPATDVDGAGYNFGDHITISKTDDKPQTIVVRYYGNFENQF